MMKTLTYKIFFILFSLSFVLLAILTCSKQGQHLWNIYIPNGWWNDEVCYYKQIEAILSFGIPKGYYGYNESSAQLLSFGAWNPLIFLPYVIIGRLIGWTFITPIIINLLFISIGVVLFARIIRIDYMQMCTIVFCIICSPVFMRYVLSCMPETIFFTGMIIVLTIAVYLDSCEKATFLLWGGSVIIAFMAVIRPYYFTLFIIPFYYAFKKDRRNLIGLFSLTVLSCSLYVFISTKLCAPYFISLVDISFMEEFKKGLLDGFANIFVQYVNGWKSILSYVWSGFTTGNEAGRYWAMFLGLWFILCVIYIKRLIKKEDKRQLLLMFIGLNISVASAIIMLYNIYVGSRHLLALCIAMIFLIAISKEKYMKMVMCIFLLLLCMGIKKDEYTYNIPFSTHADTEQGKEMMKIYAKEMPLEKEVGWSNTVLWCLDAKYNTLYYLPKGLAINIHSGEEFSLQNIQSKYILTSPGGDIARICRDFKLEVILQVEDFIMFKNTYRYME